MRPCHLVICLAIAAPCLAQQPRGEAQGKILSMQGRVEHTVSVREQWTPARVFQPLFVADGVRTQRASRAAILLVDETQVKLNAEAMLTVQQVKRRGGAGTCLELLRGEGWFRTKNPDSGLTVRTPAAAAAIRGTEVDVLVRPDNETVLTVVEGAVEFSNDSGSILVNAGEQGTARPGQPPVKRVILNPEDAVQWSLYYPAEARWPELPAAAAASPAAPALERLRAGDAAGALQVLERTGASDAWSRIAASMAYQALGDAERARSVVSADAPAGTPPELAAALATQRAAAALASGDVAAAQAGLDEALKAAPQEVRPLVLLATIELRRNRKEAARAAAERALASNPRSVRALVAASETAQAAFDLDRAGLYLRRALEVDANDLAALVNRARIRFGTDDIAGARRDAARAAKIAPSDAQVRSLMGFIKLGDGDSAGARSEFEAAAQADTELGEPHLGLGLALFGEKREAEGLLEMLTATLLEPKVSLYQSYLGKAYCQMRRFSEGLSALATAKRLDPRDPTPWLYSSLYLRDQNRQVDALTELRHAISLNDNRAVYRSRLLLDRDLATKNVSLAQIYSQLGFEAWGAYEALNSLEADYTNSSAHLFMAETYGGLPDRLQATSSELLQYFLYSSVNRNSFNSFNEYTALLDRPRRELNGTIQAGSRDRAFFDLAHRGGDDRFAHVVFFETRRESGPRLDRADRRLQGFGQAKVALGRRSDVFFSYSGVSNESGQHDDVVRAFGVESDVILLRQFTLSPAPNVTTRFTSHDATMGLKHQWRAGSEFTAVGHYGRLEQTEEKVNDPISACSGLDLTTFGASSTSRYSVPDDAGDFQAQQVTRFGRHQVIGGFGWFRQNKAHRCSETISLGGSVFPGASAADGQDRATEAALRYEVQATRLVHVTAGLAYQAVRYDDLTGAPVFDVNRWSPQAGVSVRLSRNVVVRGAAFRNLNLNFYDAKIAPPTVAGFVVERNEYPTARREEVNASIETSWPRVFAAVRAFTRDTTVPALQVSGFFPEADAETAGTNAYLNLIVAPRVSVFADNQFVRVHTRVYDRTDNVARLGLTFIDPGGFSARLVASVVSQQFTNTAVEGLPEEVFPLLDASAAYELPGKRGAIIFTASNLFERRFSTVVEGLSTNQIRPRRQVYLSFRWRFW